MARAASARRRVSPAVLEWARARAMLSRADVAKQLNRKTIDASTIEGWERGDGGPSEAQQRRLAEIFRIPERWLHYDEPPRVFDDLGIVDFRTSNQRPLAVLSQNLRGAIEHALAIQTWVAEYRSHERDSPVTLVGAMSERAPAQVVADYLRAALELETLRESASDADEFFKAIRAKLETMGVLVLRMGQVSNKTRWSLDPEEFKGFTLIDEEQLAPVIFINRKDLDAAQLFTLGHELAHLVTGGSGVSNEDIADFDEDKPDIERFCDEVAEALLLPTDTFERAWGSQTRRELDSSHLQQVGTALKVTPLLAGRRAASLHRAQPHDFGRFVASLRRQPKPPKKSGGSPYNSYPSWYGSGLTQLLASAATTGTPSASDALELLGVQFDTALRLAQPKRARARQQEEPEPEQKLPRMDAFPLIALDDSWRSKGRQ
ncbi:XRE family transcriptional regulator [Pseudenhygromyxa sp. WMMC2535]|nr:XRE family transcriptional regulator [Pseudenhygromyxa sp. WMMC2535]